MSSAFARRSDRRAHATQSCVRAVGRTYIRVRMPKPKKRAKQKPKKKRSAEPVVTQKFPIVGLGASAGGLEALETFFTNMPVPNGMAFIVVTHQHAGQT